MPRRTKSKIKPRRDVYQEVTDRIVAKLEEGVAPWRNPIARSGGDGWPKNLSSGKPYRGINILLLAMTKFERGYGSDYWMTFKQAKESGGQVRKGERGSLVCFWKLYETQDRETDEDITLPVLKHYTAFNAEQIEGIEPPDAAPPPANAPAFVPIETSRRIVDGFEGRPDINHDSLSRAFYRASTDRVHLPKPERFESPEEYYSVLFHELVHSTGHSSRLDRGLDSQPHVFGSPNYGREELVAELGAAFLCAAGGISPPTIDNATAYLDSWVKVLKGNKRLIVAAAGAAQKASDHILGVTFEDETAKETKPTPHQNQPTAEPAAVAEPGMLF